MNRFRVNLHPALFFSDVPKNWEESQENNQDKLETTTQEIRQALNKLEADVLGGNTRKNNESLASDVDSVEQANITDKELTKQLKQLAKNKKIDFPWTDNAWKCSRPEKKLATSSAKVFQQLLDHWKLQDMISRCKFHKWELTKDLAEQWKSALWINSKAEDIQNFYKSFQEYQNPQSEFQHLKNLMNFFFENESISKLQESMKTRSKKISKKELKNWSKVLYQEWYVMDDYGNQRYVIIDNKTWQEIDRKPKDWKQRAAFEVLKDRLKKNNESVSEKMLTLLWDFNLDWEVNSGDVGYKTWNQFVDVFRRTVATKKLEDKNFNDDSAVRNFIDYANKFWLNLWSISTVEGLYKLIINQENWYENTKKIQNFLKNLSVELGDVLTNWANAWEESLKNMMSALNIEKNEAEKVEKVAKEKSKEIVKNNEEKLKEFIKEPVERSNLMQQLVAQLPWALIDHARNVQSGMAVGARVPLDQIIKWASAWLHIWLDSKWKPKFWLFVWLDKKFDLWKSTDLSTAVNAWANLLFIPCISASLELGKDIREKSREKSLDAKWVGRASLGWNVSVYGGIFSYGFSAWYENDKQTWIEKQSHNINKVLKRQVKDRIWAMKTTEDRIIVLENLLRNEFPKSSEDHIKKAANNLLSVIQQFKIDGKSTDMDFDTYAQVIADVYTEQWRNAAMQGLTDKGWKISWWKLWIQFFAWFLPLGSAILKFTKYRNARTNETEHSQSVRIDAQVNGTWNKEISLEWKEIWIDQISQINEILKRYGTTSELKYIAWANGKLGRIQVPAVMADWTWINIRVSESLKWYVKKESEWVYSFPANATYRLLQETGGNQRSLTLNIGSDKSALSDVMISDVQGMEWLKWDRELMWAKKLEYKPEFTNKWEVEYDPVCLQQLGNLEEALRDIDAAGRAQFSKFMRNKREAIDSFEKVIQALIHVLKNSKFKWKYQALIDWFNNQSTTDEDKQVITDRIMSISAYDPRVHTNKQGLNNVIRRRGKVYESLTGPNTNPIFSQFADKDYRERIVNKLGDNFNSEKASNIFWATAFYNRNLDRDVRWLWITWLWSTFVLGWVTEELTGNDVEYAKNWFLWWWDINMWVLNPDKSPMEWKNLNTWVSRFIKDKIWEFSTDAWPWLLTKENLKDLLQWKDIELKLDNSEKKVRVKIDVKYVFYLMWECANESVGMELWDLQVQEQHEVDNYSQWKLYLNNSDWASSVNVSKSDRAIWVAFGWWEKNKIQDAKTEQEWWTSTGSWTGWTEQWWSTWTWEWLWWDNSWNWWGGR